MVKLGRMVSLLGVVMLVGAFIVGTGLCVAMLNDVSGPAAALLAVLLTPLTFALAPWYAALELGNWLPALLSYGTSVVAIPMILAGKAMAGDYRESAGPGPTQRQPLRVTVPAPRHRLAG